MLSTVASRLHGETNSLYKLKDELEAQGRTILDLTTGNVNEQGILFPQPLLEEILLQAARSTRIYRPDSIGQKPAREAVAGFYEDQGIPIPPDAILLTPGTSISYWYCFKLLADAGDELLCPRPSYPLFDYIAALSGVRLVYYDMIESRGWAIDLRGLENTISTKTRALVVISPHNPTGRIMTAEEIEELLEIAQRHDLALIWDEVFSEFVFRPGPPPRPALLPFPLTFTLNGFSKMFALPGMKFGWMAVTGREERVREAMQALDFVSDTFLPVNEVVQAAAPDIFQRGRDFLRSYVAEIRTRWETMRDSLSAGQQCSYIAPGGGFYVTLKLAGTSEERAAEMILRESNILVHPGYFYDMKPDHLILSFVHEPRILRYAVPQLLQAVDR